MRPHRSAPLLLLAFGLCAGAGAAEYDLPKDHDLIGEVRRVKARDEDTFVRLAREHGLGYEELRQSNPGVDAWLPGEGTEIVLPTRFVLPQAPRSGIVVNVAELRLYYFPADKPDKVITHPISVGRMDWLTPLGRTTVLSKVENPSWYVPQSIREEHAARNDPLPAVVPPGPDNPLGNHALRLGLPGYLIHGTNRPSGVGMRVTHGCIRMFPEDIEALYRTVPPGTAVHIVNQPFKLGWDAAGYLYLEAHPPLITEQDSGEGMGTELTRAFVAATEQRYVQVSWDSAENIMHEALGIPFSVSSVPGELIEAEALDGEEGVESIEAVETVTTTAVGGAGAPVL